MTHSEHDTWTLGILGGSGLYDLPGLENPEWISVASPFGDPSDDILFAEKDGVRLRFLPRHGRGHALSPSDVNYRANIDALKRSGCTDIISISAVGSLQEQYPPGDFVMVDQFIDRTFKREKSFFGKGCVAHVSAAEPICSRLSGLLADAAKTVPYATMAMVTDYDCWHEGHGNVDVASVIAVMQNRHPKYLELCATFPFQQQ